MIYVLGFRFRGEGANREVALILKSKPAFQAGKLNGVGGKVEPHEVLCPEVAMVREFYEETAVSTPAADWRKFGLLVHDGHKIHLYASEGDCELFKTTVEEPAWYPVKMLPFLPVMRNLHWLIPLALDTDLPVATIVDTSKVVAEAPSAPMPLLT